MVPPAESNLGQSREFYGFRERDQRAALGNRDKWGSTYFGGVSVSAFEAKTKVKMLVCGNVFTGHFFTILIHLVLNVRLRCTENRDEIQTAGKFISTVNSADRFTAHTVRYFIIINK